MSRTRLLAFLLTLTACRATPELAPLPELTGWPLKSLAHQLSLKTPGLYTNQQAEIVEVGTRFPELKDGPLEGNLLVVERELASFSFLKYELVYPIWFLAEEQIVDFVRCLVGTQSNSIVINVSLT